MDIALQRFPIHLAVLHITTDVDRAEVADVVRQQRLLAAGICRHVLTDVRNRIEAVGFVDEEAAGLTGAPRAVDHLVPDCARVELSGHLAAAGIDQVVARSSPDGRHELVGDSDRDVEVRDLRQVFLAGDELHDVRMIDAQNSHVGAAARSTLLHRVGARVVQLHEAHRPRRDSRRAAHHRSLRA